MRQKLRRLIKTLIKNMASRHRLALVLLVIFFVSINLFATVSLRHARLDLTAQGLFTLSDGTREILAGLEEPITLRFYQSRRAMADYPALRVYGTRVRDLLEEMVAAANGQLKLEIIEPVPFSESEDLAVQRGLVAQPTENGTLIYLGLVGTNLVDNVEVIPFFVDERQEYLEYDLARLIVNLDRPRKPIVGVLSNLPLDTGSGGILAAMQGQSQPFLIYTELVDRFEVSFLEQRLARVPKSIDVLLLAHPRRLADETLYALDQFVMRGGRVVAFIDPYSEVSLTAGADGRPLQGATESSQLTKLMTQWGLDMPADKILADPATALRVQTAHNARRGVEDYIVWQGLTEAQMNAQDLITANIDSLNIASAGVLIQRDDATPTILPLVMSSPEAGLMAVDIVRSRPTPAELVRQFTASGAAHMVAARVSGRIKTAFPDGPPPREKTDQPDLPDSPRRGVAARIEDHIAQTDAGQVVVFADSDLFDDRLWVQEQSYLGQVFGVPIADNAKFVLNAIETMMGSDALIGLRGRERASRPFTRVEALRRGAEARFLGEETALRARLDAVQEQLDQAERGTGQLEDAAALTAQYRAELVATRKALRAVQANLRRDIERLETRVTWGNIVAMPCLVAATALIVFWRRRVKRVATQRAGGFKIIGEGA